MQTVIIVIRDNSDDSMGTVNKRCPQILVAFFRHIHLYLPAATRVLSRNQTKLFGKMTTIFKFSSFANRGNNSCCCFRVNAFNFGNALAGF
ncbi:Uncharacterised protein [Klebsiella pneumoniae]|nr:Uncharacterised protein [Klebsiella pneumoniae]